MLFIYFLGIVFAITGFVIYFKIKNRDNTDQRATIMLLFFMFLTIVIWYIPIELNQDIYTVPEGLLSAILQGVAALKADSYTKENLKNIAFTDLFSGSILVVRIIIIVFIFDAVNSFIGAPYKYYLNWRGRNKATYVFSDINDKTLNIAKSIGNNDQTRMIFACEKAPDAESLGVLKDIGALYFTKSICRIFKNQIKDKKSDTIEVFIFGKNDGENISCLSELAEEIKEDKYRKTRVYVELNGTSQIIQNSISDRYGQYKRLIINFVRTADDFAYNNLYDTSIIANTIDKNGQKIIKALFIGSDAISLGMVKCILWLAQLPGYKLETEIISDKEFISEFRYSCPEIKDHSDISGLAVYSLEMHENIGYCTPEFARLIKENSEFTFAFVNSGDDINNFNIVADLLMLRKREGIVSDCTIQVRNDKVSAISKPKEESLKNMIIVGNRSELYSYSYLTNAPIENAARLLHEKRQKEKSIWDQKLWSEYCRNEYMRRSTYARALSIRYRLYIIRKYYNEDYSLLKNDMLWMMYEHMRWNVYMFTEGYIRSNIKDIHLGKTHNDLIPFDEIPDKRKLNDAISVDDEIVNSLLEIGWKNISINEENSGTV